MYPRSLRHKMSTPVSKKSWRCSWSVTSRTVKLLLDCAATGVNPCFQLCLCSFGSLFVLEIKAIYFKPPLITLKIHFLHLTQISHLIWTLQSFLFYFFKLGNEHLSSRCYKIGTKIKKKLEDTWCMPTNSGHAWICPPIKGLLVILVNRKQSCWTVSAKHFTVMGVKIFSQGWQVV